MLSQSNLRVTLLVGHGKYMLIKESKLSWAYSSVLKKRANRIIADYPWAHSEQFLGGEIESIKNSVVFILSVPRNMMTSIESFLQSEEYELDITNIVPEYSY